MEWEWVVPQSAWEVGTQEELTSAELQWGRSAAHCSWDVGATSLAASMGTITRPTAGADGKASTWVKELAAAVPVCSRRTFHSGVTGGLGGGKRQPVLQPRGNQ